MKVDGSGEKIVVQLPYNDYYSYKSLSQNPRFETVLNALTIVPALVLVIEEIKRWDSEEMNRRGQDCGLTVMWKAADFPEGIPWSLLRS